ncbi:MAG: YhbY family RNA-binding protein [Clostridia bacterium]|nr:YhbY family RNA-binding protein [Clostridia bacterium]
MMDSKTRAKLRGLANKIEASVIIGKEGITENVLNQISMNLDAHELVKISVLSSDEDYKAVLAEISEKLQAEPVQAVGKKLVLYRFSAKKKGAHVLEEKK